MDLIDRKIALEILKELHGEQVVSKYFTQEQCQRTRNGILMAYNEIHSMPTVDAVEVVRKPVRGYEENYVVDQFGRVYGVDRTKTVFDNGREYEKCISGKQMKQSIHTQGYKTVSLTKDGKTKTCYVHRIVAEAFLENPDNLPMVNHKDEDKTNNFVENLEWCTASHNWNYGKGKEKQAKALRGKKHTEEHKQKISKSMKKNFSERRGGD